MIAQDQLAKALGGKIGTLDIACPLCGPSCRSAANQRRKVMRVWRLDPGFITYCCARCGESGYCHERGVSATDPARLARARAEAEQRDRTSSAARIASATALWNAAKDPGQLVRDYHALRGLTLPDDVAGRVVRYHPRCPWGGEHRPAMILAFRNIANDQLTGIHRVALAPDATKIGRMMWGVIGGAAIKIDADHHIEQGLSVGEGYESGLAGRQLGFAPVWATGSAGAVASFPVMSGIEALTILAETDDTGSNADAVQTCGSRWISAGREVIVIPPLIVGDMNDVVLA